MVIPYFLNVSHAFEGLILLLSMVSIYIMKRISIGICDYYVTLNMWRGEKE
jgi:hypothetical protein